jgi:hypothetical protein
VAPALADLMNSHDPDAVKSFVAEGYVNHNHLVAGGREVDRASWARWFAAFAGAEVIQVVTPARPDSAGRSWQRRERERDAARAAILAAFRRVVEGPHAIAEDAVSDVLAHIATSPALRAERGAGQ